MNQNNAGESLLSKRHDYGEDCSSCRLVSGAGMIGLSVYVLTAAKKQNTTISRSVVYCISLGMRISSFEVDLSLFFI